MNPTTKSLLFTVLGVGSLSAITFFWIRQQERRGIYFPTSYRRSQLQKIPDQLEWVTFRSKDDVKLTGLWKDGHPDAPVLILAHGNAGHMLHRSGWFNLTLPAGWSGFIFDYRGYGLSEGSPSESGVYKDTLAAARFARFRKDNPSIYFHGRSLGVPVVAYASQHELVQGLILESGFPSAQEATAELLGVPGLHYLLSTNFDTNQYLQKAQETFAPKPKLIVHGKNDEIIPISMGKSLYQEAPPPKQKWFVDGAGHNNLALEADRKYSRNIKEFLRNTRRKASST